MTNKLNFYLLFAIFALLLGSCAKPIVDFSINQKTVQAPSEVDFKNNTPKAKTYLWDFGDGTTSSEVSPKHKYKVSGNYTVKLSIKQGVSKNNISKKVHVEAPQDCMVELQTEYGDILIKLYGVTPQHRDNFLKLADEGYYNDLLFHRVINGFMIQGGDPSSKNATNDQALGMGGPGYTVPAEFVDSLIHVKGALAAARMGDNVNPSKSSSGSQFYIVQGQKLNEQMLNQIEIRKGFRYTKEEREAYLTNGGTPFLDRDYTVFGQVVRGMDVIDKIAAQETGRADRPKKDIKMKISVIK